MINVTLNSLEDIIQMMKDNELGYFVRDMEHTFENSIYGEEQQITLTLSLYKEAEETPQAPVIDASANEILNNIRRLRKDKDNIKRSLLELSKEDDQMPEDVNIANSLQTSGRPPDDFLNMVRDRKKQHDTPVEKETIEEPDSFDQAMDIIK